MHLDVIFEHYFFLGGGGQKLKKPNPWKFKCLGGKGRVGGSRIFQLIDAFFTSFTCEDIAVITGIYTHNQWDIIVIIIIIIIIIITEHFHKFKIDTMGTLFFINKNGKFLHTSFGWSLTTNSFLLHPPSKISPGVSMNWMRTSALRSFRAREWEVDGDFLV